MKLLYRTRDYAFIISAMGKLFPEVSGQVVMLFAFLPAGRQVLLHSRQICNGSNTRTPNFATLHWAKRASARNYTPAS